MPSQPNQPLPPPTERPPYHPPRLRVIELAGAEVLTIACKTATTTHIRHGGFGCNATRCSANGS